MVQESPVRSKERSILRLKLLLSDVAGDACEACTNEPALTDPDEPGTEATCDDNIDNDCDGFTDSADSDCVIFVDCNGNSTPDDQDISGGTSLDCQPNGIPDECDPDGDGDGVPGDCDICPGVDDNLDGDGDNTPDGCDIRY